MIETLLAFLATAFYADAVQRQGGGWQQPPRETDEEYQARLRALYDKIRTEYLPEVLTRAKLAEVVWRAAEHQLDADSKHVIQPWEENDDPEVTLETPELKYLRTLPRTSEWGDYVKRTLASFHESVSDERRGRELVKWDSMMQAGEVPPDQPLPPGMEWKDFPTWDLRRSRSYSEPKLGWKQHMGYPIANPEVASERPPYLYLFMFGENGPVIAVWHDDTDFGDAIDIATGFAADQGLAIFVDAEDFDPQYVHLTDSGPIENPYGLYLVDNPWPRAHSWSPHPKEPKPSGLTFGRPMDPSEALEVWMAYQIRSRRDQD